MTRTCAGCDRDVSMTQFSGETHQVTYLGFIRDIHDLSGHRCRCCGEIEFDADSAARYAEAGDHLTFETRCAVGQKLGTLERS